METRTDLLNYLIKKNNYQSYLEIGVADGSNFNAIAAKHKEGVDPAGNATHSMTSNQFFSINKKKFDIIFIDGLHLTEQVDKDIENSLKTLTRHGIIIIHDCNPLEEIWQKRIRTCMLWTGDVWKSIVKLRTRMDLFVGVVNMDFGCGFVKKGNQKPLLMPSELSYDLFDMNRKKWLNLISFEEFVAIPIFKTFML